MTPPDVGQVERWLFWLAVLVGSTIVLVSARGDIDQSHAALTLLLVVLGGSVGGGRRLGFTLAVLGFVIIDYFFQPPYNLISVDKPLDWVMLAAFVAAAFVTTELLTRALTEADLARRRTDEIASLSRLGSAALRYARPEEALDAVTHLIGDTLGVSTVSVYPWVPARGFVGLAEMPAGRSTDATRRVAEVVSRQSDGDGRASVVTASGTIECGPLGEIGLNQSVVALATPLMVDGRRVGILLVANDTGLLHFDAAKMRFLTAIGYYAALAAERVHLVAEAEHAIVLRQENRAKDEVLAAVSHDLRTPLTTIKLLAQRAAARGESGAAAIEDQADRLAHMVTNLLDLSRIRLGGITLDLALNTADDLVGAAIAQAAGATRGCTIVPHLSLDEPALAGQFDFVQTLRILSNLIDNALRHASSGGIVDIDAYRDGPWLAIAVSDRGPGIAPGEISRVFAPFYRSPTAGPAGGGAGLGLSIARQLAELQGGTVMYEPRPGGGSIFTVRLVAADLSESAMHISETVSLETA